MNESNNTLIFNIILRNNEIESDRYPPLIHVAEVDNLKSELARVCRGEKFLLQV